MNIASTGRSEQVEAVVVGAGFAGLYMLHRLRGLGMTARVIEAASDVGGTWYWNRYPGARCDAQSALYSYSFSEQLEQEWSWSEKYATQPEILRYLGHVADRFDLRRDIWFDTQVIEAHYNEAHDRWEVRTDRGDHISARWCIMATGCLSVGRLPEIPGLSDTSLPVYHTGSWPHEAVDFSGLDVGVIGTGSSGIQVIPEIARQARTLTVYQRTPSFTVPARNAPVDPDAERAIKKRYREIRKQWRVGELVGGGEELVPGNRYRRDISAASVSETERNAEYQHRWDSGGAFLLGAFGDLMVDPQSNATAAEFVRAKIRDIVDDDRVAAMLTPTGFPIGAKRICVDTDYYRTFNRDNVTLVDVRDDPIVAINDKGVITESGPRQHDAMVFATGFDAMTGALLRMDIRGTGGLTLREKWAAGPRTYLGLTTAGFPNLLIITGPGSPSVLGNVVGHIEQHVEFIADLLIDTQARGLDRIEADPAAEDTWVERVNGYADATLFPCANSWYLGANVPGKPRVFMPFVGGIGVYRALCEDVAANGYAGFNRS